MNHLPIVDTLRNSPRIVKIAIEKRKKVITAVIKPPITILLLSFIKLCFSLTIKTIKIVLQSILTMIVKYKNHVIDFKRSHKSDPFHIYFEKDFNIDQKRYFGNLINGPRLIGDEEFKNMVSKSDNPDIMINLLSMYRD